MSKPSTPRLRTPFQSPSLLAGGSTACIFAISANIVVKIPLQFDNPSPGLQVLEDEAIKRVEHEKNVYKLFSMKMHPNFVQSFLCTADAIFLQRMNDSLRSRLEQRNERPITKQMQHRWIKQLASATVWLEQLDYFHGDMRPGNILLDRAGHVKLCDFGNTTKRGEELPGATYPFYRSTAGRSSSLAGPASEQFAMGSCIYTIRTGHEPLDHLSGPETVQALIRGEFPSSDADTTFGQIIFNCWRAGYDTMSQVERAIRSALKDCNCEDGSSVIEPEIYKAGVLECMDFLRKEGKSLEPDVNQLPASRPSRLWLRD